MAYGGYRMIDGEGQPSFQSRMAPLKADQYATMLEGNCIGMHATVLYRRDALLAIGGFNADFRACEDYELYLRMARHGPIAAGGELIAEYRYHGSNMSADRAMMLKTVLRVLDAQDKHVAGKRHWERARKVGRAEWKAFYARGQLAAMQEALAAPHAFGSALSGLARVFFLTPVTTIREAIMEILKRMRARWRRGSIDFGHLRRTKPISAHFGQYRGKSVDRHYIEDFLGRHKSDIQGRVLEVADNSYTIQFGGDRVTLSETLHIDPSVPNITYCTDLTHGDGIPDGIFDCIILTQTLQMIYEFPKAIATLHRILKPGGVLLVTVPGVSSADLNEWGDGWLWSFTPPSLRRMMEDQFGKDAAEVGQYGNVLIATAFLYGLAESELRPHEFNVCDPRYPVIVTARAKKGADVSGAA
jgi:SAM-dependent methyltransferase